MNTEPILNIYVLNWANILFVWELAMELKGGVRECEAAGRGGGGMRQWGECHGILLTVDID